MKESTLQIRIPEEIKEQLKDYCKKNGLTMSEAVRFAIQIELNRQGYPSFKQTFKEAKERIKEELRDELDDMKRRIEEAQKSNK